MRIEDFLLQYHPELSEYYPVIIMPDGDCISCEKGHLKEMIELCGDPDILEKIPDGKSPLFYLCEILGCVIVDYENQVFYEALTEAQQLALDQMLENGHIVHHPACIRKTE